MNHTHEQATSTLKNDFKQQIENLKHTLESTAKRDQDKWVEAVNKYEACQKQIVELEFTVKKKDADIQQRAQTMQEMFTQRVDLENVIKKKEAEIEKMKAQTDILKQSKEVENALRDASQLVSKQKQENVFLK